MQSPIQEYTKVHEKRFQKSLEWLRPCLVPGAVVLDLGGRSPFTAYLPPHITVKEDLRTPLPYQDNSADLVLCMEVIEHITDTNGKHTEWEGDGVKMMLSESFRVLRPGGVLFLTTPNAASITAIHHALGLAPPMVYRPHVREYVPYELDELVRAPGFEIIRRETYDVWLNAIDDAHHMMISKFIYNAGYPIGLRGEDIFLLARKPLDFDTSKPKAVDIVITESEPKTADPKES